MSFFVGVVETAIRRAPSSQPAADTTPNPRAAREARYPGNRGRLYAPASDRLRPISGGFDQDQSEQASRLVKLQHGQHYHCRPYWRSRNSPGRIRNNRGRMANSTERNWLSPKSRRGSETSYFLGKIQKSGSSSCDNIHYYINRRLSFGHSASKAWVFAAAFRAGAYLLYAVWIMLVGTTIARE